MSTQPHRGVVHHLAEAHRDWNGWLGGLVASTALVAAVTGIIWLLKTHVPLLGLSVLYLFAVLPIAVFWGLALSVCEHACLQLLLSTAHPCVHLQDSSNWFALGVFLVTAVVVSDLAARSRAPSTASLPRRLPGAVTASRRKSCNGSWCMRRARP